MCVQSDVIAGDFRSLLDNLSSPETIFAIAPPRFEEIVAETAALYRTTPQQLLYDSETCARIYAFERKVICYLARRLTRLSYEAIAGRLGYDDHTTVWYHAKRVGNRLTKQEHTAKGRKKQALLVDDIDLILRRLLDRVLTRCEGETCH